MAPVQFPPPVNRCVHVALIKDYSRGGYSKNLMVVSQIAAIVSDAAVVSQQRIHSGIKKGCHRKIYADPVLLRNLTELGVINPQATRVLLASCNAVASAMAKIAAFRPMSSVIRSLISSPMRGAGVVGAGVAGVARVGQTPHNQVPATTPNLSTATQSVVGGLAVPRAPSRQDNQLGAVADASTGPVLRNDFGAASAKATSGVAQPGSHVKPGHARLQQPAVPGARFFFPYNDAMPETLHACELTPEEKDLRYRYGLLDKRTNLPQDVPFASERPALEAWCTTPVLTRRPAEFAALSSETLRTCINVASRYLGFCFLKCNVPRDSLSLLLFTNQVTALAVVRALGGCARVSLDGQLGWAGSVGVQGLTWNTRCLCHKKSGGLMRAGLKHANMQPLHRWLFTSDRS